MDVNVWLIPPFCAILPLWDRPGQVVSRVGENELANDVAKGKVVPPLISVDASVMPSDNGTWTYPLSGPVAGLKVIETACLSIPLTV